MLPILFSVDLNEKNERDKNETISKNRKYLFMIFLVFSSIFLISYHKYTTIKKSKLLQKLMVIVRLNTLFFQTKILTKNAIFS